MDLAELWDADIDRQACKQTMQTQADVQARHARLAQAGLQVLTVPIQAALDAFRDPRVMRQLTTQASTPEGFLAAFGVLTRAAHIIPGLVAVERQALGMSKESVDIDDRREFDSSFANRVANDPVATDLAIALLDRIANPSSAAPHNR